MILGQMQKISRFSIMYEPGIGKISVLLLTHFLLSLSHLISVKCFNSLVRFDLLVFVYLI